MVIIVLEAIDVVVVIVLAAVDVVVVVVPVDQIHLCYFDH